ncbi:hypothetical protein K7X08_010029 [Anisodus acutangulus]|uniref:Uncharacterized protein n=1 Tax=Anisodus acutangulus TaxID=402998 RepID=A0A9Q1RVC5_9SOLA|nr:hypothetical protein K7X08_010029 [Anisodus acutangulus]
MHEGPKYSWVIRYKSMEGYRKACYNTQTNSSQLFFQHQHTRILLIAFPFSAEKLEIKAEGWFWNGGVRWDLVEEG